jgi:flagellar motor protein MotB
MAASPKGGAEPATARPIFIKRVKKVAGGHHGGAWKVAYADFVTAMMAFFMVMWLVTAVSKEQRAAIFDYFKNPSMEPGKSVKPAPGQMGPGGASTSPINLGGGLDSPKSSLQKTDKIGATVMTEPAKPIDLKSEEQKASELAELKKALEKKQLDALMQDLKEAIAKSQALAPYKDQLLLDITPEGLRLQIIDAQNRPMFDLGSSRLKSYSNDILREITGYLKTREHHGSYRRHAVRRRIGLHELGPIHRPRERGAARAGIGRLFDQPDLARHRARIVRPVQQGKSARPDQSPHQHRGDDAGSGRTGATHRHPERGRRAGIQTGCRGAGA